MKQILISTFALLLVFGALSSMQAQTAAPDQDQTRQDKDQWVNRGGFEYRVYPLRPTQWPDGTPTSPDNCAMTPAQARKYHCKTISYEGRPYYYYTGEHGKVYARRPAVTVYSQPGYSH
jgi:hypothetical protein